MKNAASRLGAPVRLLALAVLTINVLSALLAEADTQVAPDSAADQELRAVESQLAVALSSVDVDQLSRLWADDFISTMADGHIVSRERRLVSLRAKKPDGGSHLVGSNEHVDVRVYGNWATKPQTIAYSLTDSPAGLAAWLLEEFFAWSGGSGDLTQRFDLDELLTNVAVYWFSGNVAATLRMYPENARQPLRFGSGERHS